MSQPFNLIRRRFLGVAAGIIAAVPFGAVGTAHAETKQSVRNCRRPRRGRTRPSLP